MKQDSSYDVEFRENKVVVERSHNSRGKYVEKYVDTNFDGNVDFSVYISDSGSSRHKPTRLDNYHFFEGLDNSD